MARPRSAPPGGAATQRVLRAWFDAVEAEEPGSPGRARWRWSAAEVGREPQRDGDWLAWTEPVCWSAGEEAPASPADAQWLKKEVHGRKRPWESFILKAGAFLEGGFGE